MTTLVILAALLERIRHLDPFSTLRISAVVVQLKEMIKNADKDPNITHGQGNSFSLTMKTCFNLEDLLESYNLESASSGLCNKIFGGSSQKMKDDIEKLYDKVLAAGITQPSQLPRPALVEDTVEMVGMEDAKTELESALTGGISQLTLISICGVGGIGKTTLARKLVQSQKIQHHFQVRAQVRVSDPYPMTDILQEILSGIIVRCANGRDAMLMTQGQLAENIYRSLEGRRYLIVLDEVWSADAWFNLRTVFPDDSNGSRILITTETEDVAEQVGSHIHRMRCLSVEEGWLLLRLKAQLQDTQVNAEMEQIGKEIAMQVRGLPFLINSLAAILLGKPLQEWKLELAKLQDTSSDSSVHIFDVDFSYKKLPLRLRPCLLYFGNFPEDAKVEVNTLCQLWIAEGLISREDKRNKEKTLMDIAKRYIRELDKRNLVAIEQVVSGQRTFKSCRIPHLIRDFCKSKGGEDELFKVIHWGDENQQTTSSAMRRAIYLDKYDYTHSQLYGDADYLRSLLFFSSSQSGNGNIRPREIPNLDRFIWLRVLCLYAVDFRHGKLPKGVEKLEYLRYLSFRECYLEVLSSSLRKMFYLQTLDLRIRSDCEMIIPGHVLDKLESLKYLYLPQTYQIHNHKKLHVGGLKELEILENFDTSRCNAEELRKLTSLKQLAITTEGDVSEIQRILEFINSDWNLLCSTSLNIRDFDCPSKERFSVVENVFNSRALDTLAVEGYLGKLPKFGSNLPWKLTEIILSGSELADNPMQILQTLPDLRILALEVEAYIGKNMKCSSSGFLQLIYLKLSKLYKLEDWEVEKGAMPKLSTLVIESCKKLHMLPEGLKFTTTLRRLEIASMPDEFVSRIQKADGTEGDLYKIVHAKQNVTVDGRLLILKERQQGNHDIGNTLGNGEKKTDERHFNRSVSAPEDMSRCIYLT